MEMTTLYVTAPSREVALKIAHDLVERCLVACANISGEITSVYRWENEVQTSPEVAILFKTQTSLISAATERILEIHPYDCPCVVAWNSCAGNEKFFDWVQQETTSPEQKFPE